MDRSSEWSSRRKEDGVNNTNRLAEWSEENSIRKEQLYLLDFGYLVHAGFLAKYFTLKLEATFSSETSLDFQRTARRYIPEDRTLHNPHRENLKSYRAWKSSSETSVTLCQATRHLIPEGRAVRHSYLIHLVLNSHHCLSIYLSVLLPLGA
jgi:hypothetical protein